jgi:hypothetical protein
VLDGGDPDAGKKKAGVKESVGNRGKQYVLGMEPRTFLSPLTLSRLRRYEKPRPSSSSSSRASSSRAPSSARSRDGFADGGLGSGAWPPAVPGSRPSGRASASSGRKGRGGAAGGEDILNPAPPTPPTPRLSKSAQQRLKIENLKAQHAQAANKKYPRKGARELASNARKAELEASVAVIRNKVIVRGGMYGIRGIGRLLKTMDDDGSGELSRSEMNNGFIDLGIRISSQQLEDVFT